MKNKKHLKTLKLLGIILFVFGFFMIVNISYAFDPLAIAGKSIIDIFSWGITIVLYILSTIFASILMIGGWVFDWTLNLNSAIMQNPAVRVGWPIARDITNLGFVLLILIIAFSTILRMGEFTAKKALPKLIIAALLINFSLLFAGMFLDFTGILTNFFINKGITGAGDGVGISQAIIGMMGIVTILQPPATLGAESFATFGAGMLNFITNLFFINIITAVTAITMWAMAIMFLIRYVMLGLLIIVMPLAILAWVIGRGEWSEWFTNFTKYALFAPISSLFIYLAIATASEFGAMQISAKQAGVAPGLSSITDNIGSMIMIIAILMFGLGLAEKAAGMGSQMATKMAKGAATGILKGATSTALSPLNMKFGKGQKGLMDRLGEVGKNAKSPLLRGLSRPFRQIGGAGKEFQKEWGGGMGIMTGVFSGIDEGMGGKGRALREKEETQYKQRKAKITGLSAKLAAAKNISLADAEQEVEKEIDKNMGINPETAIDETSKNITKEIDTRLAMKELGMTDRTAFDAVVASNQGNITEAKKALKAKEASTRQEASAENKIYDLNKDISTSQGNVTTATGNINTAQSKLTQLQNSLNAPNLANLNPQQLQQRNQQITQDIAKTQQDITDAKQIIADETKNIAKTQKEIRNLNS